MQNKCLLILVLFLSILANSIFIYSKFRFEYHYNSKENSIIELFEKKEVNELFTENLQVNPYEQVTDIEGTSILLNSIIEESNKLILILSDNSCGSCAEQILKVLNLNVPKEYSEIILVLGSFENKREFYLISKQYPFRFFFLDNNSFLKEIALKGPFLFTLDNNYKISAVFFPIPKYQILSERYLKEMLKRIIL
jgi:hypothetical protein